MRLSIILLNVGNNSHARNAFVMTLRSAQVPREFRVLFTCGEIMLWASGRTGRGACDSWRVVAARSEAEAGMWITGVVAAGISISKDAN